jgi:zinc protease
MRPFAIALFVALLSGASVASAEEVRVAHTVLPNGVRVLVRENASANIVAISLLVGAGSRVETADDSGVTNFLHRVMVRGTNRRSTIEIATAAEDLGGGIDASGDVDYGEIRASALARNWEPLLSLVAEVALTPSLPADAIQIERRLILSQIQTRLDTPFQLAFDTLVADVYGRHPYGLPPVGKRETIQRLSREDLLAHYRAIYRPNRLVLAVSGRVPAAKVIAAAEKLFGAAPLTERGAAPSESATDVAPTPNGGRRVLDRPAQQAQILVGFAGPSVRDADYAAVKVLGAVLGGGMAGRFFVELRDKLGLAYSLGTLNPSRAGTSLLMGYMGTAPASVEPAEVGMLREIARSRVDPPSADELARAKAYLIGAHAMDRRTNARQAWYLAFFELIGAGYDFPDRYPGLLNNVTAAQVQAAAQRYLERPTIVVLRPR